MSVTPLTLANIDPNASDAAWEYTYRSTSGNYHIYSLKTISDGSWRGSAHDIKVDTTSNTWHDAGSLNPATLTLTNGVVYCYQSGGALSYAFTKPTTASWISTGGGPGTLSVVSTGWTYEVPAGVTPVEVPGRELFLNIAASAPTDSYKIYHDGFYHATVSHTTGTVTSVQDSNDACEYVLYRGTVHTSSSLNTIVATFSRPCNKVFCNFW